MLTQWPLFAGYKQRCHHHDSTIYDPWQREVATIRMIAKLPTIVAWAYKYSIGQPFAYPKNNLQYAPNFSTMCFSLCPLKSMSGSYFK